MENLVRRRELFAVVMVVALGVQILAGLAAVLHYAAVYDSIREAAGFWGDRPLSPVLVTAAAGTAVWCTRPQPTPRARVLLTLVVVLTGVAMLVRLVLGLMGTLSASSGWPQLLQTGVDLVLPLLVLIAVGMVLSGLDRGAARMWQAVGQTGGAGPAGEPGAPAAPVAPSGPAPTWQPDQASGAAWSTAGDAARGAPGVGWGASDQVGWQPIPRQPGWAAPAPGSPPLPPVGPDPGSPAGLPGAVRPEETTVLRRPDGSGSGATPGSWSPDWRPGPPP